MSSTHPIWIHGDRFFRIFSIKPPTHWHVLNFSEQLAGGILRRSFKKRSLMIAIVAVREIIWQFDFPFLENWPRKIELTNLNPPDWVCTHPQDEIEVNRVVHKKLYCEKFSIAAVVTAQNYPMAVVLTPHSAAPQSCLRDFFEVTREPKASANKNSYY